MPTVVLTRTAAENARTAPLFEAQGLTVRSAPLIELRALDADACGLRAVRRLAGGEPVLLTSAFATDLWLDLRETDFREHAPAGYYVVGRRSADLLREGDPGVPIVVVADSGESLLASDLSGVRSLLYPCSAERRDTLVDGLRARDIDVVDMPMYYPALPADAERNLREAIESNAPIAIACFSPSAVENFFRLVPDPPPGTIFAAVGPTTAAALSRHGAGDIVMPDVPSAEALALALASLMRGRR